MNHHLETLSNYFKSQHNLTPRIEPDNKERFTITHAGHTLTVAYENPQYLRFYAEYGTPNEYFTIKDGNAGKPTAYVLRSTQARMRIDEVGDYLLDILKQSPAPRNLKAS